MSRGIGYYVHHQGAGHRERARRIASLLGRPCTLIGTFAGSDVATPSTMVDLPDDRRADAFDGRDDEDTRPLGLHYAPLGHPGLRARMAGIAAWIAQAKPLLMIVDVSVEVALLARLLSVPTLYVRLAGARTDPPHLEAFRAAERLIAPFPEALESRETPDWIREKTLYAGFLAERTEGRPTESADGRIVVVLGRGGALVPAEALAEAARAVPGRDWHVLGNVGSPDGSDRPIALPPNLHLHGWIADISAQVARAALVVGGGGDGVVAAVAGAGKRFVCLPEPRPYDEQTHKAAALERLKAAVVHQGWPPADAWPGLVERGLGLDPAIIAALAEPDALARVASAIETIADGIEARERPASPA